MRLVADTNVLVSGLLWLGNPGQVLEAAASGRVTVYTSPSLLAELIATLKAPKLASPIRRSGMTLNDLLGRYLNVAIVVQPATVPSVVIDDPDDDQVLACAVAADAELIVSGDKHLLNLGGQYRNIPIVTPAQAVTLIFRK